MAPALSPSRAIDFARCPLQYRLRVLDRLPERPSPAAVRGTLVHAVLERLFDAPAAERTPEAAVALLPAQWARLRVEEPVLEELFAAGGFEEWLAGAEELVTAWFELEDPTRLEPADRELFVETMLPDGLILHGYVDRLDVAADGRLRVVDYKTGRAPSVERETRALFQMKFYALVLWRTRQLMPSLLQLVYLGSGEVLRYQPDEQDLLATERKLRALWTAIELAARSGDWQPSPGPACDWCDYHAYCPAQGGVLPELPEDAAERLLGPAAGAPDPPGRDEP